MTDLELISILRRVGATEQTVKEAGDLLLKRTSPTQQIIRCPLCNFKHVDVGEFATKPHHTHACQRCGLVWRPAIEDTVGVEFLPGCKDNP